MHVISYPKGKYFSMQIDAKFIDINGDIIYTGRMIDYLYYCHMKKMNIWVFKELAVDLGLEFNVVNFYYMIPKTNGNKGMCVINDQSDFRKMAYHVPLFQHRMIDLYVNVMFDYIKEDGDEGDNEGKGDNEGEGEDDSEFECVKNSKGEGEFESVENIEGDGELDDDSNDKGESLGE